MANAPITELMTKNPIPKEELDEAIAWIECNGGFPITSGGILVPQTNHNWSTKPEILNIQHRLAALAIRSYKANLAKGPYIPEPKKTTEQLLQEQKQKQIKLEKQNARLLMGQSSIFGEASLSDTETNIETEAFNFMRIELLDDKNRNIMLSGATGRGKTWASIAYVCYKYHPSNVCFVRAYQVAENVNKRDFQIQDFYRNKPCLLIDDLGAEPEGFRGSDFIAFLENLFDIRLEHNRQTIFTTNLPPQKITEIYGARFVDRFTSKGVLKTVSDKNYRQAGVIN